MDKKKLQILVVSPTSTFPLDFGNRKRVYAVNSRLQKGGASISFLFFPWENEWINGTPYNAHHEKALRQMQSQWDSFFMSPVTLNGHTPPTRGVDHNIDEWWDSALEDYLRWLFRMRKFDAILVNYPYLSKALTLAPENTLKILDMHDRFSGRREYLAQHGIAPEFFHTSEKQENVALNRADLVWAIKPQEAEYFQSKTRAHVMTMPHVDPESQSPTSGNTSKIFRIGFLGARNNINRINIKRFLDIFLPRLEREDPKSRFVLAGTVCLDLEEYRHHKQVDFLGPLPDVNTFYEKINLVVAPIAFSTGLKIKIIEALGKRVPTIGLSHAFEGIPSNYRYHSLSTLEEMTEACITVMKSPKLLQEVSMAGQQALKHMDALMDKAILETLRRIADFPQKLPAQNRNF